MSGYCNCACRDCFDIAIADDEDLALCHKCEEVGCDPKGVSACCREDFEEEE